MSDTLKTHVLVVGGGPGGYVAAIRCGQLGLDTVLVEADRLGGTCLIRGCIPSKALIHASSLYADMTMTASEGRFGIRMDTPPRLDFDETLLWKEGIVDRLNGGVAALLKRANVRVVHGWARFSDAKRCIVDTADGPLIIDADHVILATGSVPVELPFLPFGDRVVSSTGALSFSPLPRTLAIVGAGYIGVELGSAFAKLGVAVSMVDTQQQILPHYDAKLVEPVKRWLDRHGVALHLGAQARGLCDEGLLIETAEGTEQMIEADKILVAVGRKPRTQGWGLEEMAVAMDGAFVRVDDRCATATKGVWAIGDLVGEPMLAHKASAQGEMVAEIIAGQRRRFTPTAIPEICFTEPEIVSVGLAPEECDPRDVIVGQFPYAANGRALSMDAGDTGGFVRVVARKDDHRVLGIQAVGAHVSELALAFTQTLEMNAVLEDVTGIIHAHPTLGEAYHEASLKALGHAIHI